MKTQTLSCIAAITVLLTFSPRISAQTQAHSQTRYRVVTLGNIGGTFGSGNGINDLNWITGAGETTNNATEEATLWLDKLVLPLGTLGGPNSSVPFPIKDNQGVIAGIADTAMQDPNGENFCAFADGYECWAFWWQNGVLTGLPTTLGGNNSRAAGADNFGHVVGWAETSLVDPTCISPAVLQYVPVVWNTSSGTLQQLPTYSTDPDGAAVAINEHNQIVGISGPCGDDDGMGARHAVLWENGMVFNLPNFGGQYFNTAAAINNEGVIAGWSDVANDTGLCTPNCYGFVWSKKTGIIKIPPLQGDADTLAYGINAQNQVVGQSIDAAGNSRAFIWQDGKAVDLNKLALPGSPYLLYAGDINDSGVITGQTYDQSTGQFGPAFAAYPVEGDNEPAVENAQKLALPENVRREVWRHLGLHRSEPFATTE